MWLMFRPWSSAWPIKLNHFSRFPSQPLIGKLSLPDGLSDFSLNPLWWTWTMSWSLLFSAIALPPLCLHFTLVLQTLLRLLFCITQVGFVFMGPPFQSLLPGLFVKSGFSVPEPDWCFEASGFSLWFLTWWTAGKHGIFLQESLPHLTECCPWQTAQHSRWYARFFSPMMTSFTQLLSSLKPVTISDERNANLTLDSKLVLRVMRKQADLDSQVLIGW